MNRQTAELRSETLRMIREFFHGRGYLEVDPTPIATRPIPESTIELFCTELLDPETGAAGAADATRGPGGRPLFLLPSPELPIKRAIAELDRSVYCISAAFRNMDARDRLHEPAFTMLEWYTRDADAPASIPLCTALISRLVEGLGSRCRLTATPEHVISLVQLFNDHLGVPLDAATSTDALVSAAEKNGVSSPRGESWEDLFHRLFVAVIEPALPDDGLVYVTDWPARIPTLAREQGGTGIAERWELYVGGVEVANCYSEELRPDRVAQFLADEGERKARARVPHDHDPDFARLFDTNDFAGKIPAYSGVALGLDRLVMLLAGAESIQGVMYSPLSDMI